MANAVARGSDWAGRLVIVSVGRLLCRELRLQNEYLRLEKHALRQKIPDRLRFTDQERRSATERARHRARGGGPRTRMASKA